MVEHYHIQDKKMEQEQQQQQQKPSCEKCGSKFNYVKRDGSIVCRNCGHITMIVKEE